MRKKLAEWLGGALAVLFVVFVLIGGNVYQTSCATSNEGVSTSWEIHWNIPFFWSPGEGCVSHSLTRYAIGKIGIAGNVSSDTQHAYTPGLIRLIGVGSLETAKLLPTLDQWDRSHKHYSKSVGTTLDTLIDGDYTKLSMGDLGQAINYDTYATKQVNQLQTQLARLVKAILADRVPTRMKAGLPHDSQQFVTDWNGVLLDTLHSIYDVQIAENNLKVQFQDGEAMAASAESHDDGQVAATRRKAEQGVKLYASASKVAAESILQVPHWNQLKELVSTHPDAQEIYQQVKAKYPEGAFGPNNRA